VGDEDTYLCLLAGLACYAMSRTVIVATSGSRRTRKPALLCETTGGVPGDLDATIAVDTCLQPQCSADAAALFI
jgi:hypothetical protein